MVDLDALKRDMGSGDIHVDSNGNRYLHSWEWSIWESGVMVAPIAVTYEDFEVIDIIRRHVAPPEPAVLTADERMALESAIREHIEAWDVRSNDELWWADVCRESVDMINHWLRDHGFALVRTGGADGGAIPTSDAVPVSDSPPVDPEPWMAALAAVVRSIGADEVRTALDAVEALGNDLADDAGADDDFGESAIIEQWHSVIARLAAALEVQ